MTLAFPIVAFGASAGGLEALFEILSALSTSSEMAYVVIQHLDRQRKSLLSELLTKKTRMPVIQITEGMEVLPRHVYVIPPNASLTLDDERFRLAPRDDAANPHHPADIFFNSLSEERADAAIGVVLSGGDSDGSLGVQSIKHGGGITFAQEPSTSRFPGMPQNAIDTGCVDYVLPAAEIARELARLAVHPYLSGDSRRAEEMEVAEAPSPIEENTFKKVLRRLRTAHGVDFTHYKRTTLHRRLARRLALRRVERLEDYLTLLEEDPTEVAALYQDFLIRVTGFFRDPDTFEALRTRIFPSICENRSSKEPFRLWVPGCASGEEVYSIAIALIEYLGERFNAAKIQIFGTDVSEVAIEQARAGVYLENIAEEVTRERLLRFFAKDGDRYRISKAVRDLCVFARHDVTRDPPFSRLDLVSCRNLLIYLDATAQRRVMHVFHYALRPHGFLTLGPSETVGASPEMFELIEKHHRVYRKTGTGRGGLEVLHGEGRSQNSSGTPVSVELSMASDIDSLRREADRFLLTRYAPASLLVDEMLNILQFRGQTSPYLEHASGTASLNLNRVVRPELLIEISPAIQEARASGAVARREGLRIDELSDVTVEVVPFSSSQDERCYLILLGDSLHGPSLRRAPPPAPSTLPESEKDRRLAQLERELASTRDYLQTTVERQETVKEELRSAHEEVLSANEEFQSTNEELETAKEELQSANEELTTTNDELRIRNRELAVLNTEFEQAREVADRARKYADAIVESVREPLLVLNLELRVLRANRAFYRNFESRAEVTEGRLLRDLGAGQLGISGLGEQLEAVLARNGVLENYEFQYTVVPGARPRSLLASARKIPGDSERGQLILLAVDDVTERNADSIQLRDTDRRKDEFLAMLAHELRNPLTPIAHSIHLLKRNGGTSSNPALYDMIERQTNRLVRLVDQLLDVARINRGHIEVKQERVDLGAIVLQAADAARVKLDEFQHLLVTVVPTEPVPVDGDSVRLEQIIANLLENSAKYTPPGGRIELKLTRSGTEAVLSVRDSGIGVAPENLETIFNLFNQVDSSLARSGGGLGIGLTLVRRVLDLHGGRIEARSAGVGLGTEFVVQIPLARSDSAVVDGAVNGDAASAVAGARVHRVLIVDDNPDAVETTALLVRHWGHEVATAKDGPSALDLAKSFRPERALVDIGLPGMTGHDLGRHLRNEYEDLYLIALTGYGRSQDREATLAAGFDYHLVKPANLDELQQVLANGSRNHPVR